jgi:predicted ribosomally synthesized peptide with SipW-like signal peptide
MSIHMVPGREAPAKRRRQRAILALATVAMAALSVSSMVMTLAYFTDTETDDSTFDTGTIVLDAAKIDSLDLTTTNMLPGDAITGAVDVENDGTGELRYDVTTTAVDTSSPNGGPLSGALTIEVREVDVDTVGCGSFDGTSILAVETLDATNDLALDRVLASSASETLCIRVALPSGTDDTYQDASSVTTFTFAAEQTANTP